MNFSVELRKLKLTVLVFKWLLIYIRNILNAVQFLWSGRNRFLNCDINVILVSHIYAENQLEYTN